MKLLVHLLKWMMLVIVDFTHKISRDTAERQLRHNTGWNNQFAFPWEVSSFWNFTTSEYSETSLQNAIGCKNLDVPFEDWPLRNMGSPIFATAAMECSKQTYHNLSDIVDKFASDQQYWSIRFMEAWDIMASNGYTDLKEGPKSGWFGYYSMKKQDRSLVEELEAQMNNGGLVWTDPKADPYICGHRGHFMTSCGFTFSHIIEQNLAGDGVQGSGMGPGIQ